MGRRQCGVRVQALGFQGLRLPFFEHVFTAQECISSASQVQVCREKFLGDFGQYSSRFGRAQEGRTAGKGDFGAGICESKGTVLVTGGALQPCHTLGTS